MACPYFAKSSGRRAHPGPAENDSTIKTNGHSAHVDDEELHYGKFLQLDKLLNSQRMVTPSHCIPFHDEHLFIVTHQAFELWFLQILHELKSIMQLMKSANFDAAKISRVTDRVRRIVAIIKVCEGQFSVMGTMTAQDFLDFRGGLGDTSGFQSLQFRMIEISLGVVDELRISHQKKNYIDVFDGKERDKLTAALSEPSLLELVNNWLTNFLHQNTKCFDFWTNMSAAVHGMLDEMKTDAEEEEDEDVRADMIRKSNASARPFLDIFDEALYDEQLQKHERRLTHKAMQGALMIFLYSDEARFRIPFQFLQALMDLDTEFIKLRFQHACMVQRMIGGRIGSGGSSGYHYLRSTSSDRYKVFLDLLNMANYLIPRSWIPPLHCSGSGKQSIHNEKTC